MALRKHFLRNAFLERLDQNEGVLFSRVVIFRTAEIRAGGVVGSVDDAKGPPIVASLNSRQDNVFMAQPKCLYPGRPFCVMPAFRQGKSVLWVQRGDRTSDECHCHCLSLLDRVYAIH